MSLFSKILGAGLIAGAGWLWARKRKKRTDGAAITSQEAKEIINKVSVDLVNEFYNICYQNGKLRSSITAAQKLRLSWIILNLPVTNKGVARLKELTGNTILPDVRLFFTSNEFAALNQKYGEYPGYFQYLISNPMTIAAASASFDLNNGNYSTDDLQFSRGEYIGRVLSAANNVYKFYSVGNRSKSFSELRRMKIGGSDIFTVTNSN